MIPFGQTPHLLLRPLQKSDKPHLLSLFNDPRVTHGLYTAVTPLPEARWPELEGIMLGAVAAVICEIKPEFLYMRGSDPLELPDEGESEGESRARRRWVGFCTLDRTANPGELTFGIALHFAWWGKGLGTELMRWMMAHAFEKVGARRLFLGVFSDNEGAEGLYRFLGFKEEGRAREIFYRGGRWVDGLRMAMLDREWKARKELFRKGEESGELERFDRVVVVSRFERLE